MGYSSKNPKVSSILIPDLVAAAGTNPPSSAIHRFFNRNGILFGRTSAGTEIRQGRGTTIAKSADYTILDTDPFETLFVTTGASTITINLPAPANNVGRKIFIIKVDSNATGNVLVNTPSGTMSGEANLIIWKQYGVFELISDGTDWHCLNCQDTWIYTPTLTNVANIASSTASAANVMRVRTMTVVSGKVVIDPTSATTRTQLGISLPYAITVTAAEIIGGTAVGNTGVTVPALIYGDTSNNRAMLEFFTAADVTSNSWAFQFMYKGSL